MAGVLMVNTQKNTGLGVSKQSNGGTITTGRYSCSLSLLAAGLEPVNGMACPG